MKLLLALLLASPAWAQISSRATSLRGQRLCNPLGPPTDGQTLSWVAAAGCWAPGALGLKASPATVTGLIAGTGPTTVYTTVTAGDYRLCVTGWMTTAATSGSMSFAGIATAVATPTPQLTIIPVNPTLGPGGNGGACGTFHAAAGTVIQYVVTLFSVVGSPVYSIDATVEQIK
jgi:hypothetical protein